MDTRHSFAVSRRFGDLSFLNDCDFSPAPERPPSSRVRNILFIRPDGMGDAILAASLPRRLHELYPAAETTVFCSSLCAPLYAHDPHVTRVVVPEGSLDTADGFHRTLARLRAERPDLTVNFLRSNTASTLALSLLIGAPLLCARGNCCNISPEDRDFLYRFIPSPLPGCDEAANEPDFYRAILTQLGLAADDFAPEIRPGPDAEARVARLWAETGFEPARTVILFASGASFFRLYTRFGEAAGPLFAERDLAVLALGGNEIERDLNQASIDVLRRHGVRSLNLSGRLTLPESAALMRNCRLALGVETGLTHMAAAQGLPQVSLVGGGHFGRFVPYAPTMTAVTLPLECFHCNWLCRQPTPWCTHLLSPGTVAQAVDRALREPVAKTPLGRLFMQKPRDWQPQPGEPAWRSPNDFILRCNGRDASTPGRLQVLSAL